MTGLEHSQRSGRPIEGDKGVTVTYLFDDGERRRVHVTAEEADALRGQGVSSTSSAGRAGWALWRFVKPAGKWLAIAIVGGLIGAQISDMYADRQKELDLESALIAKISESSVKLSQQGQIAARASTEKKRFELRDKAADEWVLVSGAITPVFRTYYEGSNVSAHWDEFQARMYDWSVLACCTSAEGRRVIVGRIHDYIDKRIGPPLPERPPPVPDPWEALERSATPRSDLYQWLGFYLLRGRGRLLGDLKNASPDLD